MKTTIKNLTERGFTLLELMITLAVLAVLLSMGLPSLTESMNNNRVLSQTHEMVAMLGFARNEAIRRNASVTIQLNSVTGGWNVIVEDPLNTADVEGCAIGQLRCSSNTRVGLTTGTNELVFNNRGYIRDGNPWTSETLYLQHESCNGNNQRTRIDIMPTGQVSSCLLACNSTAACP